MAAMPMPQDDMPPGPPGDSPFGPSTGAGDQGAHPIEQLAEHLIAALQILEQLMSGPGQGPITVGDRPPPGGPPPSLS